MVSYQIFSKMEEGRRRKPNQISRSFLKNVMRTKTTTVLLVIVLLFQWTAGEEISGLDDNQNSTAISVGDGNKPQPKSGSPTGCSRRTSNSEVIVTCHEFNKIPTDLQNREEVHNLDMSSGDNSLQTIQTGDLARADLPVLRKLHLQNCKILTIEKGAFLGGKRVTTLDLSNNRLEVLDPQVFEGLIVLTTLILRGNPIHKIQEHSPFPQISSLTKLDFSDCRLDDIPVGVFDSLEGLNSLDLQNNSLTSVSWKVFRKVNSLVNLDLSKNPWNCDCHVKFLKDILGKKKASLTTGFGKTFCNSNSSWTDISDLELACKPKIRELKLITHSNPHQGSRTVDDDAHLKEIEPVQVGQDVYFECEFEGYPQPDLIWFKGRTIIDKAYIEKANEKDKKKHNSPDGEGTTGPPDPPIQPKYEFQNGNFELENRMDDMERQTNNQFKMHLVVRRVNKEDIGNYVCFVQNNGVQDSATQILNMTIADDDGFIIGGVGGKKLAVWMWVLIALLIFLILVLLTLLLCLAYRRREKKKQEGFRKVLQEKFKDSNVDIGELLEVKPTGQQGQNNQTKHPDGSTPLLDNRSENSTVLISDHFPSQKGSNQLPDIALGNGELVRNSQIFSPKPPLAQNGHITPSEARKEFFARQISEPYLRPGSAMSLTRPSHLNASQRRYIFANSPMNQSEPIPGVYGEALYAVPDHIRTLPRSGSAMSMSAIPEHDLRRQMFMRQSSQQPLYATTTRIPPQHRRNPSVSSEPPYELAAMNFYTLPRRPNHRYQTWSRPVSPTNSTCSNYSTLSWRPNVNPVTGIISDGVGPRTGADGGSTLSLNKTPDSLHEMPIGKLNGGGLESMSRAMMMTPVQMNGGGKIKSLPRNQRLGHSRTPSSMTRGLNDFFSFEPIQEIEGSETASTANLFHNGGRQTPQGYHTQSLARGEPRYKKKKPPPLANIPTNLKEPSKAFDHLKGRSVSPALQNVNPPPQNSSHALSNGNVVKQEPEIEVVPPSSPKLEPVILEDLSIRKSRLFQLKNQVQNASDNSGIVLESPIDEDRDSPIQAAHQSVQLPLPTKAPPPLPPPKPKRSQEALNKGSQDDVTKDDIKAEVLGPVSDGSTVV